jgi:hypothetical protein
MGVPATNVKDYLKLLAREYNPVKEWMESKPWDGTSRLQDVSGHDHQQQRAAERDADDEVAGFLRSSGV